MSESAQSVGRIQYFYWPLSIVTGGVFCAVAMNQGIGPAGAAPFQGLFALVLSILAATGAVQTLLPSGPRDHKRIVLQALCACVVCILSPMFLYWGGFLPSVFMAGVFALCQSSIVFLSIGSHRVFCSPYMVFGLTAILVSGFGFLAEIEHDLVVMMMCLSSLALALLDLSFGRAVNDLGQRLVPEWMSISHSLDIWLAAVLLPVGQAQMYLAARLLTLILPASLHAVEMRIFPAVVLTRRHASSGDFISSMARVNLSLFLVAGAVAVLFTAGQSLVYDQVFFLNEQTVQVTSYLLLAWAVPVALGYSAIAEDLLIPQRARVLGHTVALGIATCAMGVMADLVATHLAISFLIYRCCFATLQSVHIIKTFGIWPGPTAVFAKQIRLLR